jgi:hypothetical protein
MALTEKTQKLVWLALMGLVEMHFDMNLSAKEMEMRWNAALFAVEAGRKDRQLVADASRKQAALQKPLRRQFPGDLKARLEQGMNESKMKRSKTRG